MVAQIYHTKKTEGVTFISYYIQHTQLTTIPERRMRT